MVQFAKFCIVTGKIREMNSKLKINFQRITRGINIESGGTKKDSVLISEGAHMDFVLYSVVKQIYDQQFFPFRNIISRVYVRVCGYQLLRE